MGPKYPNIFVPVYCWEMDLWDLRDKLVIALVKGNADQADIKWWLSMCPAIGGKEFFGHMTKYVKTTWSKVNVRHFLIRPSEEEIAASRKAIDEGMARYYRYLKKKDRPKLSEYEKLALKAQKRAG